MKPAAKKLLAMPGRLRRRIGRSRDDDGDGGGGPSSPVARTTASSEPRRRGVEADVGADRDRAAPAAAPHRTTPDRPPSRPAILDVVTRDCSPGPDDAPVSGYEAAYDYDGINARELGNLTLRERMWYKDQAYLRDRRRRGESPAPPSPASPPRRPGSRVSSRYRSSEREDRYSAAAAAEQRHGRSPRGVEQFESEGMDELVRCDSRKEARNRMRMRKDARRSHAKTPESTEKSPRGSAGKLHNSRSRGSSLFDDALTDPSSSSAFRSPASRSSSLLYRAEVGSAFDELSTKDPSSLMVADDEVDYDDVTLGSAAPTEDGTALAGETLLTDDVTRFTDSEGKSYLTSLDDGTSSSYVWSLVDDDDGDPRRRRYQLGMGQRGTTPRLRKGQVRSETPTTSNVTALADSDTAFTSRTSDTDRDECETEVGTNFTGTSTTAMSVADLVCPHVPMLMEEAAGWRDDAVSAWEQVVRACFVSPEDVDAVAGRLDDARSELRCMWAEGRAKSRG